MAGKKRGLGRGLDALLSAGAGAASENDSQDRILKELPVDLVQRGKYQPRRDMDPQALEELAESIRAQGVMQPIVVRPISEGRYEIIAGERRWRASQLAGLDSIPAVIREVPDEAAIAMALIENIQREDLNPIEEARAYQHLADEEGMSQAEIAELVDKSRSHVANHQRLLALPEKVIAYVERGQLSMGHARALIGHDAAEMLAEEAVTRNLSVRDVEKPRAPARTPSSTMRPISAISASVGTAPGRSRSPST